MGAAGTPRPGSAALRMDRLMPPGAEPRERNRMLRRGHLQRGQRAAPLSSRLCSPPGQRLTRAGGTARPHTSPLSRRAPWGGLVGWEGTGLCAKLWEKSSGASGGHWLSVYSPGSWWDPQPSVGHTCMLTSLLISLSPGMSQRLRTIRTSDI